MTTAEPRASLGGVHDGDSAHAPQYDGYDLEYEGRRRLYLPRLAGAGLGPPAGPRVAAAVHPGGRDAHRDEPRPLGRRLEGWRGGDQGDVQGQSRHRGEAAADDVHASGRGQWRGPGRQGVGPELALRGRGEPQRQRGGGGPGWGRAWGG